MWILYTGVDRAPLGAAWFQTSRFLMRRNCIVRAPTARSPPKRPSHGFARFSAPKPTDRFFRVRCALPGNSRYRQRANDKKWESWNEKRSAKIFKLQQRLSTV